MSEPDPFEEAALSAVLDQTLGKYARYWELDRSDDTLMNKVLSRTASELDMTFRVFIAEDAPAELFLPQWH